MEVLRMVAGSIRWGTGRCHQRQRAKVCSLIDHHARIHICAHGQQHCAHGCARREAPVLQNRRGQAAGSPDRHAPGVQIKQRIRQRLTCQAAQRSHECVACARCEHKSQHVWRYERGLHAWHEVNLPSVQGGDCKKHDLAAQLPAAGMFSATTIPQPMSKILLSSMGHIHTT